MPDATDTTGYGRSMDDAAVDAFLREQGTGVLALANYNQAYALPLSFGYEPGRALFAFYQFGVESRKREYSEATERACLTVSDVRSRDDWRCVLAFGPLRELGPEERTDLGMALDDNAWSPDLADGRRLTMAGYELSIEEATGRQGPAATPATSDEQ